MLLAGKGRSPRLLLNFGWLGIGVRHDVFQTWDLNALNETGSGSYLHNSYGAVFQPLLPYRTTPSAFGAPPFLRGNSRQAKKYPVERNSHRVE